MFSPQAPFSTTFLFQQWFVQQTSSVQADVQQAIYKLKTLKSDAQSPALQCSSITSTNNKPIILFHRYSPEYQRIVLCLGHINPSKKARRQLHPVAQRAFDNWSAEQTLPSH